MINSTSVKPEHALDLVEFTDMDMLFGLWRVDAESGSRAGVSVIAAGARAMTGAHPGGVGGGAAGKARGACLKGTTRCPQINPYIVASCGCWRGKPNETFAIGEAEAICRQSATDSNRTNGKCGGVFRIGCPIAPGPQLCFDIDIQGVSSCAKGVCKPYPALGNLDARFCGSRGDAAQGSHIVTACGFACSKIDVSRVAGGRGIRICDRG